MTEKEKVKEIKHRFDFQELDDTTVKVSVIGENGSKPFETQLNGVTWGMLEDIMSVQERAKDDMKVVFAFFNEYVEGGGKAIPLKYTLSLFAAIAEYMSQVMDTQKN
jgi:hypothetical protein